MTIADERRRRASRAVAAGFTLRLPEVADAAELGSVHVQVWREAYPGIASPDYLDALDPQKRADGWERILAADPSQRSVTWIALDSAGSIVGFVSSAVPRDEGAPVEHELWALNVLARAHGTGAADLLIDRAIGDRPAYLCVADGNHRAIAFYRRHGFDLDGVRQGDEETGMTELRMIRAGK
ncbi:MAG: GNAT family N-acetyltransferase [Mobilicoccus sp.]|nr:GNAT family N-acetyltransferase [Mobilicoccus sp.]